MKLRVGYIDCNYQPAEGSLDAALIRVMDCNAYTNGGGYTDGNVYLNPVDPVYNPTDPILPPPPPLLEDQPADSLEAAPTTTQQFEALQTDASANDANVSPISPALLIGGGLLLLFLFGKNKSRKRKR